MPSLTQDTITFLPPHDVLGHDAKRYVKKWGNVKSTALRIRDKAKDLIDP